MRSLILTSAAAALVALAACDQAFPPTVAAIAGTSPSASGTIDTTTLAITPAHTQITVGTTLQLSLNVAAQANWTSSVASTASVSSTGFVTGLRPGTTVITAQLVNAPTRVASAIVDVLAATSGPPTP